MKKMISRLVHSASPPLCRDVADWANRRGFAVLEIHPSVPRPDRFPPEFPDVPVNQEAFGHQFSSENLRPQWLVGLTCARIRGVNGILILPDGAFCLQGQVLERFVTDHPDYTTQMPRSLREIPGTIYSLLGVWADHYYHWFHDILPRLLTALPHLPGDTRYLVPKNPKGFQLGSLGALGIHPDRLVEHDPKEDTAPEFLWFATPLATTMHTDREVLAGLRTRIRALHGRPVAEARDRLFICREKAVLRRLLNEPEIRERLGQLGVKPVFAEDLSFSDQVGLFSNAALLVAPHGAGLTNMIFMNAGCRVLELQDERDPRFCYWSLARDLGLAYSTVFGTSNGGPHQDADFRVPLETVEKALAGIVLPA